MDPNRLIGFEVDLADALAGEAAAAPRARARAVGQAARAARARRLRRARSTASRSPTRRSASRCSRARTTRRAERLTVRKGDASAPRSLAALKGRKVGTLPGSLAERILERAGADVRTYDGGQDEIYDDLKLGRTDAVLLDEPIARYYGDIDPALRVGARATSARCSTRWRCGSTTGRGSTRSTARSTRWPDDGTLRAIYERWGLWNAETARLLRRRRPRRRATPSSWRRWRGRGGQAAALLGAGAHALPGD